MSRKATCWRRPQGWVLVIALLLADLAPAAAASDSQKYIYVSPAMEARAKAPDALVMLMPTVSISVQGTWTVLRTEDSAEVGQQVATYLVEIFTRAGWKIDRDSLSEQSVAGDAKLMNLVAFLRERHAHMVAEMSSRPKDVTKGAFSFGSDVAELGVGMRSDALVFVDTRYVKPNKLQKGRLAVLTFGKSRQLSLIGPPPQISFVDALSGEVLCFIQAFDGRLEKASKMLKDLRTRLAREPR